MYCCDVWLNGVCVGVVDWDPKSSVAEVRCNLKDGWIYRAVLLFGTNEMIEFGVLIPHGPRFIAKRMLHRSVAQSEYRRCEVLRSLPGETIEIRNYLSKSQLQKWTPKTFLLEPQISLLLEKKIGVYYRIYNCKNYLLIPMELEAEDPLVELYCAGNPVCMDTIWYLCIQIGRDGRIIPWCKDEK